jgi:arabinose-5-phosphate isomerase
MSRFTAKTDLLAMGRELFQEEAQALIEVKNSLDINFEKAVEIMAATKGRVVVTGMGKSGHIGAKIAATLASTGTPAFFVHPAEMGHGDLGMLTADDVVLAISFSGNTEELRKVLPAIKKLQTPLISITGNSDSLLAQYSAATLSTPIKREACPLNLAPTSSTTAALVMGDALSVALMQYKGFKEEDFAKSHPLGSLGKSFILVAELMRPEQEVPKVSENLAFKEILEEISAKGLGLTTVLNEKNELIGIITDGDLRRAQLKFAAEVFSKTASEIMTKNPKTGKETTLAVDALKIMNKHRIADIVIVDSNNKPIGILDLKDFLAAGFL